MISALTPDHVENQTASGRGIDVRKPAGIMLPRTEFEMSENMRDFLLPTFRN